MPTDQALRQLNIALPARPLVVTRLATLFADPRANMRELSEVVESDMAIAAAVLKVVNSSLYGLSGNVRSVLQVIAFLGMREVGALTLEMSLRAAFPTSPALNAIWQRASHRSRFMSQLAQALDQDRGDAHAAGLFEECGKALLLRHDSARYTQLLTHATDTADLLDREQRSFGVSHTELGAALCETWGLSQAAVHSVRAHVDVQTQRTLPTRALARPVAALSLLAHAAMGEDPDFLETCVSDVAEQMNWDESALLDAVLRVQAELAEHENGSAAEAAET